MLDGNFIPADPPHRDGLWTNIKLVAYWLAIGTLIFTAWLLYKIGIALIFLFFVFAGAWLFELVWQGVHHVL